jgi:hypothetical protein
VQLLQQRSVLDKAEIDPLAEKEPLLAALAAASIQGQVEVSMTDGDAKIEIGADGTIINIEIDDDENDD